MTLLQTITAKFDAALKDDAQLDALAAQENTNREAVINSLETVMLAIEQVPEEVLIAAVQEHLTNVAKTIEAAPEIPTPVVAVEAIEAVIEQVAGDSEEITVIKEAPALEGGESE